MFSSGLIHLTPSKKKIKGEKTMILGESRYVCCFWFHHFALKRIKRELGGVHTLAGALSGVAASSSLSASLGFSS